MQINKVVYMSKNSEVLIGKVTKIIYQSKDNGFIIAKIIVEDKEFSEDFKNKFKGFKNSEGKYEVTIKGNLGMILLNKNMEFNYSIGNDIKYGPYLNIERYKTLESENDILYEAIRQKYIRGISESSFKEILAKYPNNIKDVIENRPHELLNITGIGHKKLQEITDSYNIYKMDEKINSICLNYGLSKNIIGKIKEVWDGNMDLAIKNIEQNPYILFEKIRGVGFKTADKIAKKMGIANDDPRRVYASFIYIAKEKIVSEGHCYLPYHLLLLHAAYELAGVNEAKKLPPEIVAIVQKEGEKLKKHSIENGKGFLYTEAYIDPKDGKEKYRIWNNELRYCENNCAHKLAALSYNENIMQNNLEDLLSAITRSEVDRKIKLDPLQRDAIVSTFCNNVSITTGGPGTGKTTILKIYLDLLTKYQHVELKDIALIAPTGKAAKRMTEAVGIKDLQASTIHRLLGSNGYTSTFNKDNKLEQEYFIVDEFSMVTIDLFSDFLDALPENAKLLMIGDIDQLPSVGAGNVLKDLIESNKIPVNKLERIFRQSERSWISQNAFYVKNGNVQDFNFGTDSEDFFFKEFKGIKDLNFDEKEEEYKNNQNLIIEQIEEILTKTNPKTGKNYILDDIMVMLPMKKGELGVNKFNELLQDHFNKNSPIIPLLKGRFRIKDKVIQIKNDYDLGVFNGEQGIITGYDSKNKLIYVRYNDKEEDIIYSEDKVSELELSYAITIHKSQGSEAPICILCLTNNHYIMLQRNLLYTGITRTKDECYLFGEKDAIVMAIKNKKIQERNTCLKEKIINSFEKFEKKKECIVKMDEVENVYTPSF